ncbi:MAG: hypothetical protein Kow0077_26430 [Anaerolineae bacterium]
MALSHLYARLTGEATRSTPEGVLLAGSQGMNSAVLKECLRAAPLALPSPEAAPEGALGFFRGKNTDFILAHAYADNGQVVVHYVLVPAGAARKIAGRPLELWQMLQGAADFPAAPEAPLPDLAWTPQPQPEAADQAEMLSSLLLLVEDDYDVVEALLSGLIRGQPVAIRNAPVAVEKRLQLVQGLLGLLPLPARYGVTYTTYAATFAPALTQIAFVGTEGGLENAVCYDWEKRELAGINEDEPYSRFIVRQLRLDAELAVRQVTGLTRTAGWRLKRGESLADALAGAARRVALDMAVLEGQPADAALVAATLEEDETIPDDLLAAYVKHLLGFILALEDETYETLVGQVIEDHDTVADEAASMLAEAINEGQARAVFNLIDRWMKTPGCPSSSRWQRLAHSAAVAHVTHLSQAEDVAGAEVFLNEVLQASPKMLIQMALPSILEAMLPLAARSPAMARTLVQLAADHVSLESFQAVVQHPSVEPQLPTAFRAMFEHFQPGLPTAAPVGLLVSGAESFGGKHTPVLLARLVEWAVDLHRPDLIDPPVLAGLVELSRSPLRDKYETLLRQVIQLVSEPGTLALLEAPGPHLLGELYLLLGEYRATLDYLELVATTHFSGPAQADYGRWVRQLFADVPLETPELARALRTITRLGLKPLPTVMAYHGVLAKRGFEPAFEPLIRDMAQRLVDDRRLMKAVGPEMALRLVAYYAKERDEDRAISLAAVLTTSLEGSEKGLQVMGHLWRLLDWNEDVREAALELLRRYARQLPAERGPQLVDTITRQLGPKVGAMIRATCVMNIITGGAGMLGLIGDLHRATGLLFDIAAAYEQKERPTLRRLRSDLDALTGGASDAELERIGEDILAIAKLVWDLGGQDIRTRKPDYTAALLRQAAVPRTGLEALLWLGGYVGEGKPFEPNLVREIMPHVLGDRSVNIVREDVAVTRRLLERLQQAFANGLGDLTLEAFAAEIDSLWQDMRLYDQRQYQAQVTEDAQALPFLVRWITKKGNPRALESGGLGRNLERARREPRGALEAMRLLYGYFMRQF